MTVTWSLNFYDPNKNPFFPYGGNHNFTDRLQGFDITQDVHPARMGRGETLFRLSNFDGALTPNAGGTYANVDWGKCVAKIECTTPTATHTVFVGVVSDFTVNDNGVASYVDFVCDDPYAIAGRSITEDGVVTASSYYTPIDETIQNFLNLGTSFNSASNGVRFPALDKTLGRSEVLDVSGTDPTLFYTANEGVGNIAERIGNGIMPASAAVLWPSDYRFDGIYVKYQACCVGEGLSADTDAGSGRIEYTLTENPTGAAQELALENLQTGHNLSELTNKIKIKTGTVTGTTPATYYSENQPTTFQYGTRAATWQNHFQARSKEATRDAAGNNIVDLEPYADALTNRFSEYRYTAQTATTRQTLNTSSNAQAAFGYLCDIRWGQWAPITVKYTPTGAASQISDVCVIGRRRLRGTPSDVTVELGLLPAIDYQSLVLDSDMLGTLNDNRLG